MTDANEIVRYLFTACDVTFDSIATMQNRLYFAQVQAASPPITRFLRHQCALTCPDCLKVLPEWQHCTNLAIGRRALVISCAQHCDLITVYQLRIAPDAQSFEFIRDLFLIFSQLGINAT